MSPSLPVAANLEQLRKQAKDLARSGALKLSDAQLAIAREYGFPSWPRLKAYVERLAAHGPGLQHAYHEDVEYYEGRAEGLLASAVDGTPGAVTLFGSVPLTAEGARSVVAVEHGFADWAALQRHVTGLRDSGEPFARAYRAVEAHDLDALGALLTRFPELAAARGTNGNDLLGMASATCDERLVRLLLDHGANVHNANAHGWTALHQAAYSNLPLMAELLLDAGARVDVSARGEGGTPLVIALFWGNRVTAELLAERGVAPVNLRTAAGLGLVEEIATAAGPPREFYRPHGGFPAWAPSDEPQEALDEAVAWAARNDRVEAIDALAARGAALDRDVYRGTPLAWAAACGRVAAIRHLVARGVDPNSRGTFGGPDHGKGLTALHLAAQNGDRETVDALLDLGADPTLQDGLYGGTPANWAEHGGHAALRDHLRAATRQHPESR